VREYFFDLISRAWTNVVQALGTTTLSIVVWSFLVPVAVLVVASLVGWVQRKKRGEVSPFKAALSGSIISVAITAGVTLCAWTLIITYFTGRTIFQDHEQLASANADLRNVRDALMAENARLKLI
jgi:ABC-type Fe3+-siderophore transport system permease subunit